MEGGPLDAGQLAGTIKDCSDLGELARILQEQRGALDHLDVSAAWECLVRTGSGPGEGDINNHIIVGSMQEMTRDVLDQMDGGGVAKVMHSVAQLYKSTCFNATMGGGLDRGLLEAMQRRATALAGEFNPQDVANVLWALVTMGEAADPGLLEAMQRRATATAGEFEPRNVAMLLWAL
ncbi:hypothetical protein T484DRAFT_1806194, partial [Baffinella frigidus]